MKRASLLAALVVLLLAGCGGDSQPTTPAGGDATDEQTTEETTTEETTEEQTTDEPTTEESSPPDPEGILPPGGKTPKPARIALAPAARAAGCELKSFRGTSRKHTSDSDEKVDYSSAPPTSGKHLDIPAEDAAYVKAPDVKALVHSLEHGRVVIWFKADAPRQARASLRAFYADDPTQILLTPDETGSAYAISATAWNRAPAPNGTGRLLGCAEFTPKAFAALAAFERENRGKGPENIP